MTKPHRVVRDTRENKGWIFPPSTSCLGTVVRTLPTGDYTAEGIESDFIIERKRSISEWSTNLGSDWPRFKAELERLKAFPHAFIILEFSMADLMNYPEGCGLPARAKAAAKTSPAFLLKRTLEIEFLYNSKVIFAGPHGWDVAASLFKRAAEHVTPKA